MFSCEYYEIFKNTYLKNICERLLLNVTFNSFEEQHLLVKLDEMVQDIIMFYIDMYHFVFYPEAVVGMCSLKVVFKSFTKFTRNHLYWSLFLSAISNFIKIETPTQMFSC